MTCDNTEVGTASRKVGRSIDFQLKAASVRQSMNHKKEQQEGRGGGKKTQRRQLEATTTSTATTTSCNSTWAQLSSLEERGHSHDDDKNNLQMITKTVNTSTRSTRSPPPSALSPSVQSFLRLPLEVQTTNQNSRYGETMEDSPILPRSPSSMIRTSITSTIGKDYCKDETDDSSSCLCNANRFPCQHHLRTREVRHQSEQQIVVPSLLHSKMSKRHTTGLKEMNVYSVPKGVGTVNENFDSENGSDDNESEDKESCLTKNLLHESSSKFGEDERQGLLSLPSKRGQIRELVLMDREMLLNEIYQLQRTVQLLSQTKMDEEEDEEKVEKQSIVRRRQPLHQRAVQSLNGHDNICNTTTSRLLSSDEELNEQQGDMRSIHEENQENDGVEQEEEEQLLKQKMKQEDCLISPDDDFSSRETFLRNIMTKVTSMMSKSVMMTLLVMPTTTTITGQNYHNHQQQKQTPTAKQKHFRLKFMLLLVLLRNKNKQTRQFHF